MNTQLAVHDSTSKKISVNYKSVSYPFRFYINLSMGPFRNEQVDTALHFNPRFESENQIVRNSYHNKKWANEERGGPSIPLVKGQQFECIVLTTNQSYKVRGLLCLVSWKRCKYLLWMYSLAVIYVWNWKKEPGGYSMHCNVISSRPIYQMPSEHSISMRALTIFVKLSD